MPASSIAPSHPPLGFFLLYPVPFFFSIPIGHYAAIPSPHLPPHHPSSHLLSINYFFGAEYSQKPHGERKKERKKEKERDGKKREKERGGRIGMARAKEQGR